MYTMDKCIVILTAHKADLDKTENAKRQADLFYKLHTCLPAGHPIVMATGSFRMQEEEVFVVPFDNTDVDICTILGTLAVKVCQEYDQEATLMVDSEGTAKLMDPKGQPICTGLWVPLFSTNDCPIMFDHTTILGKKYVMLTGMTKGDDAYV